jgi:hypothetical protein
MVELFDKIDYLAKGNSLQKRVYHILCKHHIFELLAHYNPLLAGTIPIDIAIDGSDLDIICCFQYKDEFKIHLEKHFSAYANFKLIDTVFNKQETILANFIIDNWEIEAAYLHMIVEHQLLQQKGESFRQEIINLKKQGYKTEPAFAKALNLAGNPYEALLALGNN